MSIFALIDCNNFYASCERVFNPQLENKPVIILSNNDGCVISRSNEAKKLGVPMGAPFYKWKELCDKNILYALSSNYALYGDMSKRVMDTIQSFCPAIEFYSIDEAFISLDEFQHTDLVSYLLLIKQKVKMWTGIPVSIGIGPTKTLAKLANQTAKNLNLGLFDIRNTKICTKVLSQFPAQDIWGIGRNLAKKLADIDITTAIMLQKSDTNMMRKMFGIIMEKIIQELRGISCLPLEDMQDKKQIISSRSFGKPITNLSEVEEALSNYTAKACVKLRQQNSVTNGITIFLKTNYFNKNIPQYSNSYTYYFPKPSSDTLYIIQVAKDCLKKIYRNNFHYKKVGIVLLNLFPKEIEQLNLFSYKENNNEILMKALDLINSKMGKNSIFICAEGIDKKWSAKCNRRTPRYTTRWDEIPKVVCK